jgi:hypothetical protein
METGALGFGSGFGLGLGLSFFCAESKWLAYPTGSKHNRYPLGRSAVNGAHAVDEAIA